MCFVEERPKIYIYIHYGCNALYPLYRLQNAWRLPKFLQLLEKTGKKVLLRKSNIFFIFKKVLKVKNL